MRVALLGHCKDERIEPPTPERAARIVDSGILLDGVVKADRREFAVSTDSRGRQRVVRILYECSVLEALRDPLRCKETLVVGADTWARCPTWRRMPA